MKRLPLVLTLLILFSLSQAQVSDDFSKKFEQSRMYMQEFQYDKASPILEGILETDPTNANLQFLLAICFTMGPVVDNRAISLLENAKLEITDTYDSRSPEEKGASMNVHFYFSCCLCTELQF